MLETIVAKKHCVIKIKLKTGQYNRLNDGSETINELIADVKLINFKYINL